MEFVTYKIGKKLQEKGYIHGYNRFGYRPIYSDEYTIKYLSDIGAYEKEYYGEDIPCPTISQVLDWLRTNHGMHVRVDLWRKGWYFDVISYEYDESYNEYKVTTKYQSKDYKSYDNAMLAGIEYVLDNLI
jgi:hypothetical protein